MWLTDVLQPTQFVFETHLQLDLPHLNSLHDDTIVQLHHNVSYLSLYKIVSTNKTF